MIIDPGADVDERDDDQDADAAEPDRLGNGEGVDEMSDQQKAAADDGIALPVIGTDFRTNKTGDKSGKYPDNQQTNEGGAGQTADKIGQGLRIVVIHSLRCLVNGMSDRFTNTDNQPAADQSAENCQKSFFHCVFSFVIIVP